MKRALIVILAALILPMGVLFFQRVVFATQYAPGYSEAAFERIRFGDSAETVKAALGEPLYGKPYYGECQYSRSGGAFLWKYRAVGFSNGVVVEKRSSVVRR